LTPRNEQVRALVLVAVQSGYWRHWPGLKRYGMAMLWYCFMPGLTKLLSYGPMAAFKLGENLPKGVALQWARWGRTPHYIVDAAGQPIRSDFASFKAPVLSYSFADDSLAPKAAVDALMEYYENAPIERRHLQPGDIGSKAIGHFGFFRERYKTPLWESSLSWLNSQLRPEQPAPAVV
jgi:predicted alpha/beta hydrolase